MILSYASDTLEKVWETIYQKNDLWSIITKKELIMSAKIGKEI